MVIIPRRITSKVQYWRTGHGFGVHSPFAYHFITRVLREELPYYDFDKIKAMEVPIVKRHARLLYRLTDFFRPRTVWVGGGFAKVGSMIIGMANSSVRFVDSADEADMAVYVAPGEMNITPGKVATVVFGADSDRWEKFTEKLTCGMTFANGKAGVAVFRQGLPRQDYKLNF